jgi:hypothetical protein
LWTAVSPGAAFLFLAAAMIISVTIIIASRPDRASAPDDGDHGPGSG